MQKKGEQSKIGWISPWKLLTLLARLTLTQPFASLRTIALDQLVSSGRFEKSTVSIGRLIDWLIDWSHQDWTLTPAVVFFFFFFLSDYFSPLSVWLHLPVSASLGSRSRERHSKDPGASFIKVWTLWQSLFFYRLALHHWRSTRSNGSTFWGLPIRQPAFSTVLVSVDVWMGIWGRNSLLPLRELCFNFWDQATLIFQLVCLFVVDFDKAISAFQ